jgi:hypothetical protein
LSLETDGQRKTAKPIVEELPSKAAETDAPATLNLLGVGAQPGAERTFKVAQAGPMKDLVLPAEAALKSGTTRSRDAIDAKIEGALNGSTERPGAMKIPDDVRQLVVVTTDGWSNTHGQLRMFERAGADQPWHQTDFSIPVNVGENGMGYGVGGVIPRESVTINGQEQRVGGPRFSVDSNGDTTCSAAGNAKCEGDGKTTAGLFRLGVSWGTTDASTWAANDMPPGTTMPYIRIDADYRVVPKVGEPLFDQQGHLLNGSIIREVNPQTLTYERFENGAFVKGTLTKETLGKLEIATRDADTHYRWVHKDLKDEAGRPLSEMLVRIHPTDASSTDPSHSSFSNLGDASFLQGPNGTQLAFNNGGYDAIDPKTGEKFNGTLSAKTLKGLFNDSDYKWADSPQYEGYKLTGFVNGLPQYSETLDDRLYNHPTRIINAAAGEYEHLDPATGKSLGFGRMDPQVMQRLINNAEDMNDAFYRYAVNILQNTGQQTLGGSALFVHQESYLRRNGNRPDDTAGCVSMSLENLRQFISRLQQKDHPAILISPLSELDTVRAALQ